MTEQNETDQKRRERADLVKAFTRRAWQPSERTSLAPRVVAGGVALIVVAGAAFGIGALTSYTHKKKSQNQASAAMLAKRYGGGQQPSPGAYTSMSPAVTATPSAILTPSVHPTQTVTATSAGRATGPKPSGQPAAPARGASVLSSELPMSGGNPWALEVHAPYKLNSGQTLRTNRIALTMQAGGDLVLRDTSGRIIWDTGTHNAGVWAQFQTDGNLVVYGIMKVFWTSGTSGHNGATLVLQADDNMVIYGGPTMLWATGTHR